MATVPTSIPAKLLRYLAMAGAARGDVTHAVLPVGRFHSSRTNLIFRNEVCTQCILIGERLVVHGYRIAGHGRLILHIEHLIARPKILARIAMATEAPLHLKRSILIHQRHLVDWTMTGVAAHALGDVDAVIEKDEVGELVHSRPLKRLAGTIARANRLEKFGICPNLRVAVHAGLRRRNPGETRVFN